jgi:hypothetical protein
MIWPAGNGPSVKRVSAMNQTEIRFRSCWRLFTGLRPRDGDPFKCRGPESGSKPG